MTVDTEPDIAVLCELTESLELFFDFPTEPRQQFTEAISAVFDPWMGKPPVQYRRTNRLHGVRGHGPRLEHMVYGTRAIPRAPGGL